MAEKCASHHPTLDSDFSNQAGKSIRKTGPAESEFLYEDKLFSQDCPVISNIQISLTRPGNLIRCRWRRDRGASLGESHRDNRLYREEFLSTTERAHSQVHQVMMTFFSFKDPNSRVKWGTGWERRRTWRSQWHEVTPRQLPQQPLLIVHRTIHLADLSDQWVLTDWSVAVQNRIPFPQTHKSSRVGAVLLLLNINRVLHKRNVKGLEENLSLCAQDTNEFWEKKIGIRRRTRQDSETTKLEIAKSWNFEIKTNP